ncbi:hypothetical protein [Pseudoduganella violaceinigra]|uniref:hypothetical protein n=1 Tax=Pseudoduganella violaceinigra TaxID=246602 RepID=UPI00047FA08A|nr:hypothetical protein [Pseudoduganella violaceinigra]
MRKLLIACVLAQLAGCTSLRNLFSPDGAYSGIAPPPIHTVDPELPKDAPIMADSVAMAAKSPYEQYYQALQLAKDVQVDKDATASLKILKDYVEKGITVVNVSCLRWFRSLAEAEIRFNYAQSNQNVIQDLGTTLLGIGKANPLTVGVYGAGFTAANGFEKSFSQSFFLAPNSNKVKAHMFSLLDKQAEKLQLQAFPNFQQAYLALERYGDICTQQTAKEIINSSLDQTNSKIQEGGRVQTVISDSQLGQVAYDKAVEQAKAKVEQEKGKEITELKGRLQKAESKQAEQQTDSARDFARAQDQIAQMLKERNEMQIRLDNQQKQLDTLKAQVQPPPKVP